MGDHPVQLRILPSRMARVQVLVRLLLLVALGAIGCSSAYWVVYLTLPLLAALLLSQKGAARYLAEDAPRAVRVLRWFAGAYAYLWLLTDALPTTEPVGPVELSVSPRGTPAPGSALVRLVTSLPALLLLAVVSIVAAVLWVVGAIMVLATERVPKGIADFIAMKLRSELRLVAYHLSIVDAYPSLADAPLSHAPQSGAA